MLNVALWQTPILLGHAERCILGYTDKIRHSASFLLDHVATNCDFKEIKEKRFIYVYLFLVPQKMAQCRAEPTAGILENVPSSGSCIKLQAYFHQMALLYKLLPTGRSKPPLLHVTPDWQWLCEELLPNWSYVLP